MIKYSSVDVGAVSSPTYRYRTHELIIMPIEKSQPNTLQSGKTKTKIWHIFKRLLIVTSMLGLMASNILTLVNDDIHTMGFNALKAMLTPVVSVFA